MMDALQYVRFKHVNKIVHVMVGYYHGLVQITHVLLYVVTVSSEILNNVMMEIQILMMDALLFV
jgi:hypothetical protein